jgi:hypothetical protein
MPTSVSVTNLQSALKAAQIRLERAVQALAPKHKGGELEEFAAAQEALLAAERARLMTGQKSCCVAGSLNWA